MKKSLGIGVRLADAESVRRYLRQQNILREDLKLMKDQTWIYFPVLKIPTTLSHYQKVELEFEERRKTPRSYKEIVNVPDVIRKDLPTSYDIVGDIILIKIPSGLLQYQQVIGKALLSAHKNIRTVCRVDPVTGELRTRPIVVIAGEKRTTTIHKEQGLSFFVDVQRAYFSPRLSSERKRVARLVGNQETVVDMFTGVGPFAVTIARYASPKIIYAIDKNAEAVRLAKENIIRNHVLDRVEIIHADANDIAQVVPEKANRIIMNLPFSAMHFFSYALGIAQEQCVIHYYDIVREDQLPGKIATLHEIAATHRFELSVSSIRKMKTYAPREFYIGIDITARKRADVA
ncbi:MAG TPA: class I SAM-dependent methyltransferase family protein [Candidatus Thermoplasmatota archaeon]|nr:class I SAM-dependent methyltransferase family protein [Candidatus Thermoplasmatota archaeon]